MFARVEFDAPDRLRALGQLADFAQQQSDEVLSEALRLLTEPGQHYRRYSAKSADITDAIRSARRIVETRAAVNKPGKLIWRGSPEFDAAITKVEARDPAWAAALRSETFVRRVALKAYGVEQEITPTPRDERRVCR